MDSEPATPSVLPIYDLFVDLPHPAASCNNNDTKDQVNSLPVIIGPPPGATSETSKTVGRELVGDDARGLARLARFAFPEFHDQIYAQEVARKQPIPGSGAGLNKYDVYFQDFTSSTFASLSSPYCTGASYYVFAVQLASGDRVFGHVRRYLPPHAVAKTRIDVGRRSARAMILLTRNASGEKFYLAVLKSIDVISSQRNSSHLHLHQSETTVQTFLHAIHYKHARLCEQYTTNRFTTGDDAQSGGPTSIVIPGIEFGPNCISYLPVNTSTFLVPPILLYTCNETKGISCSSSHILPLLRCLGISHSLRLLSALLCECRIVLLSRSPARLSGCCRGALAMLAQGALSWQHAYIPILPPGMINHLAAPMPYLIGLMAQHASVLPRVKGLGEVLVINLDSNSIETHNIQTAGSSIPDLLRTAADGYPSAAEILSQDLNEIMKMDSKLFTGDRVVQDRLSNAAGMGKDFLRKGLEKWWERAQKSQQKQNSGAEIKIVTDEEDCTAEEAVANDNYAYGEGYTYEVGEEEARIAFTAFFLHFIGDMKWYMMPPAAAGVQPVLDPELFVKSRKSYGEGPGSPMYPLICHFKGTKMFDQFVKKRIAEIATRKNVAPDAPLFILVASFHRTQLLDFSLPNVRRSARQVCQDMGQDRFAIKLNLEIRRRAMALTSNTRNEAMAHLEMTFLVKECHEITTALVDVVAVVWDRIRDSRGMQWKHALYALQLLRELLLHGPVTAITEATDGMDKIRGMKTYENTRVNAAAQIRRLADHVWDLMVNRAKLFTQRRACAFRRIEVLTSSPRKVKDTRFSIGTKFKNLHLLCRPDRSRITPALPQDSEPGICSSLLGSRLASSQPQAPVEIHLKANQRYVDDLLLLDFDDPLLSTTSKSDADELLDVFSTAVLTMSPRSAASSVTGVAGIPSEFGRRPGTQYTPTTPVGVITSNLLLRSSEPALTLWKDSTQHQLYYQQTGSMPLQQQSFADQQQILWRPCTSAVDTQSLYVAQSRKSEANATSPPHITRSENVDVQYGQRIFDHVGTTQIQHFLERPDLPLSAALCGPQPLFTARSSSFSQPRIFLPFWASLFWSVCSNIFNATTTKFSTSHCIFTAATQSTARRAIPSSAKSKPTT